MSHDVESLREELAEAFSYREYPGDNHIAHSFEHMAGSGGNRAKNWLRGKTWLDVLQEGVPAKHAKLPQFLMFDAWLYYFPAFAILALDPDESRLAQTMLFHLGWNAKEFAYRASNREKVAIVHWLETMSDLHEEGSEPAIRARETLSRHRDTFLESAASDDHLSLKDRDVKRLRAELAEAFAGRKHPGDDNIADVSPGCRGLEAAEAREWLRGKTWQGLLEEGMGLEHGHHVSFLRLEGWLYFFPAFATFALDVDHPAALDEALLIRLGAMPYDMIELLEPQERRAVAHFVKYLAEAHERLGNELTLARPAFNEYWAYFYDDEEEDSHDP